jgi:Na+/melibiose symporter-like transporter
LNTVSSARLSSRQLLAYAFFALPLAMAALPVYVHAPKLYSEELGLSLATIGAILLACRLLDALQDPLLGYLSDRLSARPLGRNLLILWALPPLAVGFFALFNVPALGAHATMLWLTASLVLVYLGFSMASISYYARGAELSQDYHERTRITAARGALAVTGVLIAAALPQWMSAELGMRAGLAQFTLVFLPILLIAAAVTVAWTPRTPCVPAPARPGMYRALAAPLSSVRYRWLIAVSVLSGIAAAIPATLILFYVQDVLRRPELSGLFLGLYFLFGAAGMPMWVALARRAGKKRAWLLGMLLSVVAFVWAYRLGAGDAYAFGAVCVLSGLAYGAELAIPPSILADIVDGHGEGGRPDGTFFGLWQMVDKLNLALAAGLALPLLQWLGYQPGQAQAAGGTLSSIYALAPCAVKLLAGACLWFAPLETRNVANPKLSGNGALA